MPALQVVLAPNPGLMTGPGTNRSGREGGAGGTRGGGARQTAAGERRAVEARRSEEHEHPLLAPLDAGVRYEPGQRVGELARAGGRGPRRHPHQHEGGAPPEPAPAIAAPAPPDPDGPAALGAARAGDAGP